MNRFLLLLLLGFGLLNANGGRAATIFESGTLGPTGVSSQDVFNQVVLGSNVHDGVFEGVRFEL